MKSLRIAIALAVLGCAASWTSPIGAQTGPRSNEPQQFVGLLNQLRTSLGLAPLQVDPELTALAQDWAVHVATVKQTVHPDDPRVGVTTPWTRLGENVAYGSTTQITWQGLLDSPSHYRNMVDPGFTHIGIGIAYADDGVQWISQRFMEIAPVPEPTAPTEAADPPPAAPQVTPEPAPVVEVLGAVETRDVNLAVIPPIRYGDPVEAAIAAPNDGGSDSSPPWPVLALALAALLLLLGGGTWLYRSRRA